MLDGQAKQEYRQRLRELREELEELRQRGDHERGEKVKAEIDFIEREIVLRSESAGGNRRAGSAAERALSQRQPRNQKRVAENLPSITPDLGEFLEK